MQRSVSVLCATALLMIACVSDPTILDGGASDGGNPSDTSSGDSGMGQRIFLTSVAMYPGGFGPGTGGADKACTSIAKSASLSGTWLAVLSDQMTDAKDRVTIRGRVVNMMGDTVATNAADLWDGTLAAAIRYDEHAALAAGAVWSSTNPDGTRAVGAACNNWSDEGNAMVLLGTATATDAKWIANVQGLCSDKAALYCLEQ